MCYGGRYLVRPPPPVGPVGQIWKVLFNEPSLTWYCIWLKSILNSESRSECLSFRDCRSQLSLWSMPIAEASLLDGVKISCSAVGWPLLIGGSWHRGSWSTSLSGSWWLWNSEDCWKVNYRKKTPLVCIPGWLATDWVIIIYGHGLICDFKIQSCLFLPLWQ